MKTITVIATEADLLIPDPLIYTVTVKDPQDIEEVLRAVEKQREEDIGEDAFEWGIELHFAFEGDLYPVADWRT